MSTKPYHPEEYWSTVADRISDREGRNVIAGDDEPYYRYKRVEFLKLLRGVDFQGKSVLELGSGPGGNLKEVYTLKPAKLMGADISQNMVELATKNTPDEVKIVKINGTSLPFEDNSFDIVFTATVLQHNTDKQMMETILKELARVSKDKLYLFERIETTEKGDDLCMGRPVDYYASVVKNQGMELQSSKFINIRVSYYISGMARKLLNPSSRKEGEPLNGISRAVQNISLPITKILDKIFTSKKDLARLEFTKRG